jgi:hypothetical protein
LDSVYKNQIIEQTKEKLSDNLNKLQSSSKEFLNSINRGDMTMDGVSGIIKKIFNLLSLNTNYEYLVKNDPRIFQLKITKITKECNKQVTSTIIPGLDMIYSWYSLTESDRKNMWFYLENMFNAGTRMINLVNNDNIKNNNFDMALLKEFNYSKIKKAFTDFLEKFPESSVINIYNLDVDPFLGIGVQQDDFGVSDMVVQSQDSNNTGSGSGSGSSSMAGIGSMMKLMGVDKMLDMTELSKQLQNIGKTEIDDATENIKSLLGNNLDEGTTEMIGTILNDITDQLKNGDMSSGNPLEHIMGIAEKVAKNTMPKIDKNKIDMSKILESTNNIANNYRDKDGKPVLSGAANPFSMLSGLLQSQMGGQGGGNNPNQMKMMQDMMMKMMQFGKK